MATVLFAGGVLFSYFVVLPRALGFLTSFGEEFFQVEIRASYYFSFVTLTLLSSGLAFQMPIFILALVRLRILTAAKLRRNRRIGYALMIVFAVLLPTVDPVSLALEVIPLVILFELSIQLASVMERRWDIAEQKSRWAVESSEGPLRRLGAAGGGRADRATAPSRSRTASSPRSGRQRARRGRALPRLGDRPGVRQRHTHLEYAVYAGFGDGLSFGPWISTHVERKRRLTRPDMEAIARLGAAECLRSGVTTVGDLAFTGASAHACAELGLRAIVYLEVFGKDGAEAMQRFEEKRAYVEPALSERVRLGISPHAPYTCSRDVYAASMALDLPVATHLNESQDELDWLLRGGGPWQPFAEMLVEPEGMSGIRSLAAAGLLNERVAVAHCVKVDAGGDRPPRRPRRRRHPLSALERAARLRDRTARGAARRGPAGRDRHRRRLLRAVPRLLRGAAHGDLVRPRAGRSAPTRSRRPRRSSSRPSVAPARSASRPRPARWCPASGPTSRSSRFPARRIYHGRIRQPPWSTAAHRSE